MTSTDMQSTAGPRAAYAAARFALGSVLGCLTFAVTVRRGGVPALAGPPLAFFAGAFWAAGELQLGLRGRFGFGAAAAIATFGSLLALVATQGMTGRENFFIALCLPYAVVNTVGAALGLLVILPGGTRAFLYAVLGFAIGGVASGAIAAVAMGAHQLNSYTGPALVGIPGIVGGTAAAWASTSVRKSDF